MCDKTRRSSDAVRRTCARPTTTIAAAITTTTVATSVAAAALPPANSTAPIAAALTTPTLPAAIPTPSLAASIAAASEPAAIAAATEHEAPEHDPPERRPEERTFTLGDVQRALRIRFARPKLTGRAKPGIRSWRGRSSRAAAAGARCRSRAHVAGWRGRWQCTATRHSLPAARAAAARRTRCWLRVRRRLPPAARAPHARRLSVRHRLPPESKALPSRASVRRAETGVAAGRGRVVYRLCIARASPPPKSRAAACVSVSSWCVCSRVT